MANGTYSCDFDAVYQKCQELNDLADELENLTKGSDSDVKEEMGSWSGDTSESMNENTTSLKDNAVENAAMIREYSNWLKSNAQIIEEAEDQLAQLKI